MADARRLELVLNEKKSSARNFNLAVALLRNSPEVFRGWFRVRVPADLIQQIAQRISWPIQQKHP